MVLSCLGSSRISAAPKATFLLGNIPLSFSALEQIFRALFYRPSNENPFSRDGDSRKNDHNTKHFEALSLAWTYQRKLQLHRFGARFENFSDQLASLSPLMLCSDSRDSIYGFLGLNHTPEIVIEPDYRLSMRDVLISTAIAIIRGRKTLGLLKELYRVPSVDGMKLPSWVPDYRCTEGGNDS